MLRSEKRDRASSNVAANQCRERAIERIVIGRGAQHTRRRRSDRHVRRPASGQSHNIAPSAQVTEPPCRKAQYELPLCDAELHDDTRSQGLHEPERKRNVANPRGRPHEARGVLQLYSAAAPEQNSSFDNEPDFGHHAAVSPEHAQLLHAGKASRGTGGSLCGVSRDGRTDRASVRIGGQQRAPSDAQPCDV